MPKGNRHGSGFWLQQSTKKASAHFLRRRMHIVFIFHPLPKISLPVRKTLTNPMQGLAGDSFLPDGKEPAKAQGAYPSFLSFRKKENQEDEIREMSFLCETLLWTRAKKLPTYPASILWVTPRPPR